MEYVTVSCRKQFPLLEPEHHKAILLQNLQHLTARKCIEVYAYFVFDFEFHLIWRSLDDQKSTDYWRIRLLKSVGQAIRQYLLATNQFQQLSIFKSQSNSGIHHYWNRPFFAIPIASRSQLEERLAIWDEAAAMTRAIERKWRPEYSSANYYRTGRDVFKILTHYNKYFPP
jgi:HD-GYP domain-containing protein (c-di-GMP phosphodiesterase class II)